MYISLNKTFSSHFFNPPTNDSQFSLFDDIHTYFAITHALAHDYMVKKSLAQNDDA